MIALALDGITSFSAVPLRAIGVLGLLVFLLSVVMSGWVLWTRLFTTDAIPGWASSVIPMYFLGGLQLLSIGVVGVRPQRSIWRRKRDRAISLRKRWGCRHDGGQRGEIGLPARLRTSNKLLAPATRGSDGFRDEEPSIARPRVLRSSPMKHILPIVAFVTVLTLYHLISEYTWMPPRSKYLPDLVLGAIGAVVLVRLVATQQILTVPLKYLIVFFGFCYVVISGTILNDVSAAVTFAGIRNYFKFLPLFLIPFAYKYSLNDVRKQFLVLLCFALLPASSLTSSAFL